MAVLGASRAFDDWKVAQGIADENAPKVEGEVDDVEAKVQAVQKESEYSDNQLRNMESTDALELIDSLSTRVGDLKKSPKKISRQFLSFSTRSVNPN
jgi:hypothetical protein